MAAQPQDGGFVVPPNALGALLLDRGAITEGQLEDALRHQQISGEQLGAILVELGYASSALIALALATQHGGTLKTEYGFATGFGSAPQQEGGPIEEPPVSVYVAPPSAPLDTIREASPVHPDVDHSVSRAEIEQASLETRRLTDANEQLVSAMADLELRLGREAQRYADLELEIAELRSVPADPHEVAALEATNAQLDDALAKWQSAYSELEQRLGQAGERVAGLEAELARRDLALEELRSSTSATDATHAELVLSLANEVRRADALKEQLVAVEQQHLELSNTSQANRSELEQRLGQAGEQVAMLEAELARRDLALEELRSSTSATDATHAELVLSLANEVRRADALKEQLVAVEQQHLELSNTSQANRSELEQRLGAGGRTGRRARG